MSEEVKCPECGVPARRSDVASRGWYCPNNQCSHIGYFHPAKPDNNPKHAAGRAKQPYRHIPPIAIAQEGKVMQTGGDKYGPFNWGEAGVVASVYYDAILRHLHAWYTGESNDPESGMSHLAHVRACCGILIDCTELGNLQDDRPTGKTTRVA